MDVKDKNAKAGSKTNLNESSVPLLEDIDPIDKGESEKESMELKEKASSSASSEGEKDDSKTEKPDGLKDGEKDADTEVVSEEPKKQKKTKHRRGPSRVQTMTVGLNLLDRDEHKVNEHVNLSFEDVIAEPDNNHSFDFVWRLSYLVFSGTKLWTYRLLAALCALPCAIVWGINFALLTFCNIWFISPCLRTVDVVFYFFRKLWTVFIRTILDPLFGAIGMIFGNVSINVRQRHENV